MAGYAPRPAPKRRIKPTPATMDSSGLIRDLRPIKPPTAAELAKMKKLEMQRRRDTI